jgi:hypothetical protein
VIKLPELIKYLLIPVLVLVAAIIIISIVSKKSQQKTMSDIKSIILSSLPNAKIKSFSKSDLYQFEAVTEQKTILVKVVFSRPEYEFIITNSNRWTVNSNPMQWSRKSKPDFIKDSHEFTKHKKDMDIKKIVLVYPAVKQIIRYLNESDTVFVKPEEKYNNIHFVSLKDFEKILFD